VYKITDLDVGYCDALCYKFHARYGRIPDEDQIQDCREFMCRAAKKYKPELSPRFMTYARWWILAAVQKEYVRVNHSNGYIKNNDVFYQGLHVNVESIDAMNNRNISDEYEKKDLAEKILSTASPRVEQALRRKAEGENYTDMLADVGCNTRQALKQSIDWWRKKQGIVPGEKHID